MKRARVRVNGSVQGVFFRVETRDRARSLGVSGWVRNVQDGAVEAVFEGPEERVESMVEWCRRGPAGARVESVDVDWEDPVREEGFAVQ
jgi:acylphosphatase